MGAGTKEDIDLSWLENAINRAEIEMRESTKYFTIEGREYKQLGIIGNTKNSKTYLVRGDEGKVLIKSPNSRLPEGTDSDEAGKALELFYRESKVLDQLNHPQIPKHLGEFTANIMGETSFYNMQEYFDGPNVENIIYEKGRIPLEEAIRITLSVLKPLRYCHQRDPPFVHRDIKPANIIWNGQEAKLVDFGVVLDKAVGTPGNTVAGTPGYMAPEQWISEADEKSDIYAVGASLLHMITGKHPETMLDNEASDFEKRFKIHYEKEIKKFKPKLQKIIAKCLDMDANKRYNSVDSLEDSLHDYLRSPEERVVEAAPKKKKVAVKKDKSLAPVKKPGLLKRAANGVRALPAILGCTAASYLLGFENCDAVQGHLPVGDINIGYHLAVGSGLYGGGTKHDDRKVASLATLGASYTPELMMLAGGAPFSSVIGPMGVKTVGYGLGYVLSYIFTN